MNILVTGSGGFVGKHLMEALGRRPGVEVIGYDLGSSETVLEDGLRKADIIFHLAGVNRPQNVEEFQQGNADFTAHICDRILELRRANADHGRQTTDDRRRTTDDGPPPTDRFPIIVLSSSIQAELDNPYGRSKRQAEKTVEEYAKTVEKQKSEIRNQKAESRGLQDNGPQTTDHGPQAVIFRLKNIFGKWCRPNYNSVTATFCHNVAHALPITISDPSRELELVYIDDVVAGFLAVVKEHEERTTDHGQQTTDHRPRTTDSFCYREVARSYKITLGELADRIRSFRQSRQNLLLPAMNDELTRNLYVTYLTYLDGPDFAYTLDQKVDARGSLAEFIKSPAGGQLFVSRTKPGITRGNHYHHSKTEKFLVVEGEAVIRFRSIQRGIQTTDHGPQTTDSRPAIIEHRVSGHEFKVVDIPPGYTHSIENVGTGEMVCLFWASEVFDPQKPDTYFVPVIPTKDH